MMKPKAVAAYLPEQSIVAEDFVNRLSQGADKNGRLDDVRSDVESFAAES